MSPTVLSEGVIQKHNIVYGPVHVKSSKFRMSTIIIFRLKRNIKLFASKNKHRYINHPNIMTRNKIVS